MAKRKRTASPKSATQLRNARKRAAKKREKVQKRQIDPSLVYIDDPLQAPTVLEAQRFLAELLPALPLRLRSKEGWRSSAKLAVRAGSDGPKIGLFLPKSHDVISVMGCSAHHPAINRALEVIMSACKARKIRGYDEHKGTGDLRYVKLDVQRSTELVQATLVWNAGSLEEAGPLLTKLVAKLKRTEHLWHSIWANLNAADKHSSRILAYDSEAWQHLHGSRHLREILSRVPRAEEMHVRLCFPPFVFRQANLCAFEDIVSLTRRFVPQNSAVVELYGGVGTIGLHLADLVSSLVCSDENPHNRLCFRRRESSQGSDAKRSEVAPSPRKDSGALGQKDWSATAPSRGWFSCESEMDDFVAGACEDEHLEAQRFLATLQGKVQLVQLMRFRALEALRSRDAHDGR
ncbi:unnamed protein product [Cladocopium goreaui]|uniref:Uncharacterized RNA methyltransferase pc1998 n=1 Tax=Cladocopium goreaui TaxID=2562237 RepID=A0A9P1CTV0_9DINO|nr:unnamed protein product [Cladocopium goreaui]